MIKMTGKQIKTLRKEYEEILFKHLKLVNQEVSRLFFRCHEQLTAKQIEIQKMEGKK